MAMCCPASESPREQTPCGTEEQVAVTGPGHYFTAAGTPNTSSTRQHSTYNLYGYMAARKCY